MAPLFEFSDKQVNFRPRLGRADVRISNGKLSQSPTIVKNVEYSAIYGLMPLKRLELIEPHGPPPSVTVFV